MEKLLNKAIILIFILLVVNIGLATMAIKYWLASDYRITSLFLGSIFVFFGLILYTFRLVMFPDERVDELEK